MNKSNGINSFREDMEVQKHHKCDRKLPAVSLIRKGEVTKLDITEDSYILNTKGVSRHTGIFRFSKNEEDYSSHPGLEVDVVSIRFKL